jgi:hypothetical protein
MGHEYCGIVEEVGNTVRMVKPGQLYTLCRAAAAALFQMSFRSEITISLTPRAIEPPNAVHIARRCAITGPGALASESRKTMYPVMKLEYRGSH